MAKKLPISLRPTIRVVNHLPIHFYSPQQIEEIVPVTVRLSKSPGSNMTEHRTHSLKPKGQHFNE